MSRAEASSLLIVDDDQVFREVLSRAFERRGFRVRQAGNAAEALATRPDAPDYAIVDLKLPDQSGLAVVRSLHERSPATRILVLTGYSSIATAVEAIKVGATNYLPKPATPDEILQALQQEQGNTSAPIRVEPPSVARLEWEHIQKVLSEHDGNISATARALRMHRRTLQRKLAKRPVRQ